MMTLAQAKEKATEYFPETLWGKTEWIELPAPRAVVDTSRGKFSVHAQRFPNGFVGDFWSSYHICFVYLGDEPTPIAKT